MFRSSKITCLVEPPYGKHNIHLQTNYVPEQFPVMAQDLLSRK